MLRSQEYFIRALLAAREIRGTFYLASWAQTEGGSRAVSIRLQGLVAGARSLRRNCDRFGGPKWRLVIL
jgi:hypothetical protein